MELPDKLCRLYRHWGGHTSSATSQSLETVMSDSQLAIAIEQFINERMMIWRRRQEQTEPPYTTDPILRDYRFCNILRELDRQTIEYHELLQPLRNNFPLWLLNMFYARLVARPETVRTVGLLSFSEADNQVVYERLMHYPRPRYGTPYVFPVSAILGSDTPTRELFIAQHLPRVMERIARDIEAWHDMSVEQGVEQILPLFGFNLTFLWTEVLIDVAYQYPERIDLFGRFPIGPGAAPTLARIASGEDATAVVQGLGALNIPSGVYLDGQPIVLSSENWEGIACEFRKYTNLQSGHGRKRRFSR